MGEKDEDFLQQAEDKMLIALWVWQLLNGLPSSYGKMYNVTVCKLKASVSSQDALLISRENLA